MQAEGARLAREGQMYDESDTLMDHHQLSKVLSRDEIKTISKVKTFKKAARFAKMTRNDLVEHSKTQKPRTTRKALSHVRGATGPKMSKKIAMLASGSTLALESNSVPKPYNQTSNTFLHAPNIKKRRRTVKLRIDHDKEAKDAEEFIANRKTLLQGDLEVLSELSFNESESEATKTKSSRMRNHSKTMNNETNNMMFQTVNHAAPKDTMNNTLNSTQNIFGIRRNTFQKTNSVLDEEKKGYPVLGLDRFEQKVTGKTISTPKYKNDDLNEENGFKGFK